MLTINTLGENITIEVADYGSDSTIHIKGSDTNCEIHISKSNLDYLRQKLNPNGLIPDDFQMKIVMLNQLIEELEDIRDKDNPDWELKSVYYVGGDVDSTFFDTKEVEI
jgi:hypothetical protein